MLEKGQGRATQGLWAQGQAASLVESNTLYSAQECVTEGPWAGFLTKSSASNPRCKQSKGHHVNHWAQRGGGSAQGHTGQHTGKLGAWPMPRRVVSSSK